MTTGLRPGGFSAVVAYYNEAAFLPGLLASLHAQTRPLDRLILVDNGSTDHSEGVCRRLLEKTSIRDVLFLTDPRPGKINALETGCRAINTEFVMFADADTRYPPHYVGRCAQLFAGVPARVVALVALSVYRAPESRRARWPRRLRVLLSKVWRKQAFTGAYGHVVRTAALHAAGGYSVTRWALLRGDHELMHRVFRHGVSRYDMDLWCWASNRRPRASATRWNLTERVLYHLTPYRWKNWYFYRFLGPRLERRGLNQLTLRRQTWRHDADEADSNSS